MNVFVFKNFKSKTKRQCFVPLIPRFIAAKKKIITSLRGFFLSLSIFWHHVVVKAGRPERPLSKLDSHLIQLLYCHILDPNAGIKAQSTK